MSIPREIAQFANDMKATTNRISQINEILARIEVSGGVLTTSMEDMQDGMVAYRVGPDVLRPYLEAEMREEKERAATMERKAKQILEIITDMKAKQP